MRPAFLQVWGLLAFVSALVVGVGVALPNFKSQSHTYDALDRLIGSRVGTLDASGTVPTFEAFRDNTWALDALGNPNGRELGASGGGVFNFVTPGRTTSGDLDAFGTPWAAVLATPGDAADDASQTTFQTDRRNRFKSYVLNTDLPEGAGGLGTATPGSSIEPTYDAAGNCSFDGRYFYQYDAWNRLVQVNRPAAAQPFPDGAAAMVIASAGASPSVTPGALVKHFTYDALGRLIRTQSPFPNPSDADGSVRTERFYYDGIRRIQEVVIDPVQVIEFEGGVAGNAGDGNELPPQLQQLANQNGGDGSAAAIAGQGTSASNVDGSTSTSSFEQAQLALNPANGPANGSGNTSGSSNLTGGNIGGIELSNATLAREYIWGPGGSFVGASVDELLVQIDGQGVNAQAGWVMQDAGGDVVALAVNTTGSGSAAVAATGVLASATGIGSGISFRVAAQQEYDAYGQVSWAEHLLNHAALHVGHKGLFVDRLDVGVGNGSGTGGNGNPGAAACAKTFGEPPRIVPLAFNLAQNRNRTLHTSWGRYLQQDPNASGCSLVSNEAMNAGRTRTAVALMQIQLLYGNGANLYNYLGNRPMAGYDPLGLYFGQMATWDGGGRGYDPFDWVDDFIAEDAGSKAAFLNNVIGAARTTGYILGTIAQMHPAVGIAVAAYNIGSGQGSVWDVVAIVGGGGASLIGKTIGAAVRTEALTAGAVKIGSRLLGVTGHEWHHIIPRFLGGADDALQMLLPVEKHREFHAILRTKLKEIGLENAGNWSKADWARWMKAEAGNAEKALGKLMDACVEFDDRHGYGLVSKLASALKQQGFAPGAP